MDATAREEPDPRTDTPAEPDEADGLSAKQIRFCQLYFDTDNATQAYIDAGLPHGSRAVAGQSAHRLLNNVEIVAYLTHLRKIAADAARVTVEELASLVACFAKADLRRLMTPTGEFLPMDEWPDDVAIAVESVETEELLEGVPGQKGARRLKGHTRKVKLVSKMSAAAKLMEWRRMLGKDKADDAKAAEPMVVGGQADPKKL